MLRPFAALALVVTLAGCATPTAVPWLDRRDLAATAHCPPPPLVGEADTCQHLAWDFRR